MKKFMESKGKTIKNRICIAHFRGIDGLGTCNSLCQWYRKGEKCPNSNPKSLKRKTKE